MTNEHNTGEAPASTNPAGELPAPYVAVPRDLPFDVLGEAGIAGVFETGNPKHGWDYLLAKVGKRLSDFIDPRDLPVDTGNAEIDGLIERLCSSDPDFEDCTAAAVLLRKLAASHRERSERDVLNGANCAQGEAVAEVIEAEGCYITGGWTEPDEDARKVKGLKGIRGLPIGTKLYTAPPSQPAAAVPDGFLGHVAIVCRGTIENCQPKPQRGSLDERHHNGRRCLNELAIIADDIDKMIAAPANRPADAQRDKIAQVLKLLDNVTALQASEDYGLCEAIELLEGESALSADRIRTVLKLLGNVTAPTDDQADFLGQAEIMLENMLDALPEVAP